MFYLAVASFELDALYLWLLEMVEGSFRVTFWLAGDEATTGVGVVEYGSCCFYVVFLDEDDRF